MSITLLLVPQISCFTSVLLLLFLCGYIGWCSTLCMSPSFLTYLDPLASIILVITIILVVFMLFSVVIEVVLFYVFSSLLLILTLILTTTSIVMFYLWFELSLIPIVLLILGWGNQPERLLASLYMFLYTITSSLPFLLILLYSQMVILDPISMVPQPVFISMCLILPFCVKLPLYYLHLWLPNAHVEAPVFGSMILAATILKIGSYGVWRLSISYSFSVLIVIISISLFSAGLCSFITLSQVDIKAIIAYSSVVHIGIVLSTILIIRTTSSTPALIIIISHGICSSGIFYTATLSYERISTRNLSIIQGLTNISPSISLPWVLLLLINLSSPPTLSLLSELFMSGSLFFVDSIFILGISLMVVLVLVYSLLLYYSIYHGHLSFSIISSCETVNELTISNSHSVWFILWIVAIWLYEI